MKLSATASRFDSSISWLAAIGNETALTVFDDFGPGNIYARNRQRPVHLTTRGEELLRAVEQIYAELEQEWAQVIGASHMQRMRRDLTRVLSDASNGELPPVRPTW
jgi:hypothetical protein